MDDREEIILLKWEWAMLYIGGLLCDGKYTVKMLETKDKWFGVTYKEDKELVVQSFKKLIEDGVYREELYSDLCVVVNNLL